MSHLINFVWFLGPEFPYFVPTFSLTLNHLSILNSTHYLVPLRRFLPSHFCPETGGCTLVPPYSSSTSVKDLVSFLQVNLSAPTVTILLSSPTPYSPNRLLQSFSNTKCQDGSPLPTLLYKNYKYGNKRLSLVCTNKLLRRQGFNNPCVYYVLKR